MDINILLGYLGALLIGLILGLVGGGGSILTIPVLVYLLHINPITATAYSLFIVGVTASIGAFKGFKKKLIAVKIAVIFAIPAFIGVFISRHFIMPAIPDTLFSIGTVTITKNIGIMVFFAIIMLLASLSMIIDRKEKKYSLKTEMSLNYFLIILEGMAVGIITGIVGAGGGFLIIPALVLFANLPIKKAVSTSLLIISIKSLIGFLGDIKNINIDWHFLLSFTTVTILGILIGDYFSNLIEGVKLKKGFGWFALIMSIVIIFKELT